MKSSSSQTNFFSRSLSKDVLKSPPITNNTKSFFIKKRNIIQNKGQFEHQLSRNSTKKLKIFYPREIEHQLSSNSSKKLKSFFPREIDSNHKSLSTIKIKSSLKKENHFNLPIIKRIKPVIVKSFNIETHNLHKEITKSLSEKKAQRSEINDLINLDKYSEGSKEEEGYENVENNNILEESLIRQNKNNALELLNQFGLNQVYKDVVKFTNLPKESIIDEVYSTLQQKNTERNFNLKKTNSTIFNKDENCNLQEMKRFYFEEKIDPQIIMKNHRSWREVNINFSFPYFLKDQNLLFKIMEQNSENLRKYNKLK